jgi:hypothetical protein
MAASHVDVKIHDSLVQVLDFRALGADLHPLIQYLAKCEQVFSYSSPPDCTPLFRVASFSTPKDFYRVRVARERG